MSIQIPEIMIKSLLKSEFVQNIVTLTTGTAIAQAIPILISPILTRLYGPEDFAVLALYVSITSLIAVIVAGRYELALVLPKEDKDAINILGISILITLLLSGISFILVFFGAEIIVGLLKNGDIRNWLYLIPLSILLTGLYQSFNYWLIRKKSFKKNSFAKISDSSANSISKITLGFTNLGPGGLIIGNLIGQMVGIIIYFSSVIKDIRKRWNDISKNRMIQQAKEHQDFPKINSLHAFSDILQTSITVFLISMFFGPIILGWYALTFRIMKLPLGFIGVSTGQVFFQKASRIYAEGGDISILAKKTMWGLAKLALPVFMILLVFGPKLFTIVFGEEWREAGVYAQILSPWLFFNFIISPVSQIPIIVKKQKNIFYLSLIGNSLIIASILYGCLIAEDIKYGFFLLSFLQIIYLSFVIFWIIKISKFKQNKC